MSLGRGRLESHHKDSGSEVSWVPHLVRNNLHWIIGRRILYHWTTREDPTPCLNPFDYDTPFPPFWPQLKRRAEAFITYPDLPLKAPSTDCQGWEGAPLQAPE